MDTIKYKVDAQGIRDEIGYLNTLTLIEELTALTMCPESICDGSGKISKTFIDSDSNTECDDGDEDCLCIKN